MSNTAQALLFVLCVAFALLLQDPRGLVGSLRRRAVVRRGPVAGYMRVEGASIDAAQLLRMAGQAGGTWSVVSIEAFHTPGRRRLLLRVSPNEAVPAADGLELLARAGVQMGELDTCAVVAVDDTAELAGAAAVFSPDGRGWTGREVDCVLVSGPSPQQARMRAAVAAAGRLPAAGWFVPSPPSNEQHPKPGTP